MENNKISNMKWIKCIDRFPDENQEIIAFGQWTGHQYGIKLESERIKSVHGCTWINGHFEIVYNPMEAWGLVDVTHWMPLPKPPKE